MKRYLIAILSFFTLTLTVFADGTKQLMPNKGTEANPQPAGYCYIALGSREGGNGPSRAFARYNTDGTSCDDRDRIYIRIDDCTTEKIYVGFGGVLYDGQETTINNGKFYYKSKELTIKYRVKQCVQDDEDVYPKVDNGYRITETDANGKVIEDELGNPRYKYPINVADPIVFPEKNVPTSGTGYINNYQEAYWGPNILYNGTKGYQAQEIEVPNNGLYYIEFYIGYDFYDEDHTNHKPIDFKFFDVSVIENSGDVLEQKKGRVYSRAWGLNANGTTNDVWSTFYTYSTDHYTSKVYFAGPMPYRFVFCCNSFGSIDNNTVEENRKSFPNPDNATPKQANYIPEYKIFLTSPDTKFYGEAKTPILPKKLQFAGDAMTCEDLIFVMQLAQNESATIELYLNNDGSTEENSNAVLIDKLESSKAVKRGYHYPWKDSVYVDNTIREIKQKNGESGGAAGTYYYSPIAEGCTRNYKLSLFDQRFKYNSDTLNVGDSLSITLVGDNIGAWLEPLGSENNPILISTQEELEALAEAVNENRAYTYVFKKFYKNETGDISRQIQIPNNNGFAGVHFYLTAPTGTIILNNQWEGIGTETHPFRGTFRCGKYQPDPAHISNTDNGIIGDQDTITFYRGLHGLFNYCEDATIDNIHIKGGFKLEDDESFVQEHFGTICSYAKNTKFSNCSYYSFSTNAKDSINAKSISYNVGGIIGYAEDCQIDSCYNKGTIFGNKTEGATGGIVASINNTTVNFCFNIGSITQSKGEYAGGIVGSITGGSNIIENCNNQGFVMSSTATGGIVGLVENGTLNIIDCLNNGSIEGTFTYGKVGGIVGATSSSDIDIKYCLNTGSISSPATSYAFCENENIYVKNSLSTGSPKQYILDNVVDLTTTQPSIGSGGLNDDHFYEEEDGTIDHLLGTACNGGTWRMEEAGRLFRNDTTFYLNWDGKFDNGECITGSVTINYQKNTGVTHFPFFDPENNWYDETKSTNAPAKRRGLVVYRISPIADTIKQMLNGTYTEWQTENNKTAEDFGYIKLPKNIYQTETVDEDEYGIEMKLYWDDRNISYSGSCNPETITSNGNTYKIGRHVAAQSENILVSGGSGTKQYCVEGNFEPSKCKTYKTITYTENGLSMSKRYCSVWIDKSKPCKKWSFIKTVTSAETCYGIENVTEGGYYGSEAGGHIFPIHTTETYGFGNAHIINTWWNGIEVKGINTLNLLENDPAVLMPIVLTRWNATNLSHSVLLEWTTASEENNNYFSIERSIDGVNWVGIGKVYGAGTTSMTHSYSLEDTKPISGISYYRLKQIDYNEEYTYSSVICINRPSEEQDSFLAYTNAENNTFIIEGNSIAACPIELYDILGHKVSTISFNPLSTSKVAINVEKLPTGSYIIKCCNKSKTVVKNW